MHRFLTAAGLAALVLGAASCGGYGGSSPTDAGGSPEPPANAIIINVVGINGARSFSPNPATVPPGQTVSWHNVDTTVHRVVLNDGELDTGDIRPGLFSAPMTLVAAGPYHCTIHPEMIGTIAGSQTIKQ